MLQLPSHHRVRPGVLARGVVGAVILSVSGLGLLGLAAAGEIHPGAALLGLVLAAMGGWLSVDTRRAFATRLRVDESGVEWTTLSGTQRLPWLEIQGAHLTRRQGELRAITLRSGTQQIVLAEDLERWPELRADLCERLGVQAS